MGRHRALAAATMVLVLAAGRPARAEPAQASPKAPRGIGIRLLDGPAGGDARAHSYIVDRVDQGARLVRHVEVSNTTGEGQDLALYVAGANLRRGAFTPDARGVPSDLAAWSHVDRSSLHLADGGVTRAEVVIAVPRDADDGEHYGAVLVERSGHGSGQITINSRVGVRIYLSVGSGVAPVTDFRVGALTAGRDDAGKATISTTVTNVGERAVDLVGELALRDGPGAISAGPFAAQVPTTLAAGDTLPVLITLDPDIPVGPWLARVNLRSGSLSRTAEGQVSFPAPPPQRSTAATVVIRTAGTGPGARGLAVPAAGLAWLAAVGGLVVAARRRPPFRTSRRRP